MTLLFTLPLHQALAAKLAPSPGLEPARAEVDRFANGELRAVVRTPCAGRDCVLLGAVAPPDGDLLATLLLAHTLKREGARRVTGLVPYLGYSRQDRPEPGRSLGVAWLGTLLAGAGLDAVVTVDVHSAAAAALFPIPLVSLSPAPVFAAALRAGRLHDPTVVAPDAGARERCEAVRDAAGLARPIAVFTKQRSESGIRHLDLHGEVGPEAVVVDDILDTGETLVSACERLGQAGVRDIVVLVTHGLFTGRAWSRLPSLGVRSIFCTDTTPGPPEVAATVGVLSVAPVLQAHLTEACAVTRR